MKPRRRDLFRALLRRELTLALAAGTIGAAVAAVLAASSAADIRGGAALPLFDRFVLRFDLTALGLLVVITNLRMAARIADDHAAGWLEPWAAQGGDRRAYMPGVALAACAAAALLFSVTATAFAGALVVMDDAFELARLLPASLIAGVVLLAAHALFVGTLGIIMRNTTAAFTTAALLTLAPTVAAILYLTTGGEGLPRGIEWWAASYPPPLLPPAGWRAHLAALLYCVVVLAVSIPLAGRFVGRRP